MGRLLVTLLLLAVAGSAGAAEVPVSRDAWTFSFYLENDLFADTDEDYTNGVGLNWVSPDLSDFLEDPLLPAWVRQVNRHLTWLHGGRDEALQRNLVISLGQKMFTPSDRYATALIPDDRPYAGWLYLGFGYHVRDDQRLDSAELHLGTVGPASLAKEAQDLVHDLRGIDKFEGWDNQLGNEPGLQLILERKQRLAAHDLPLGLGWDLIGHAGLSLGNVATYLNGGAEVRAGWHLPADFGTSSLRPGGNNSAPGSATDPRLLDRPFGGLHAFLSTDVRLVARDIFLDGNTFRDSPSVDKRNAVGEAAMGVSALVYGFKFSFARVFLTPEFEGESGTHSYGSVAVSYSRRF